LGEEQSSSIEFFLQEHLLLAPELIRYETANGIVYAKRKGKAVLKNVLMPDLLEIVLEFPIQMVPMENWWSRTLELVQKYDLTFYDASYLGVASALKAPILSLDKEILKSALTEKLEIARAFHH
jgi:predicted nucleic acid-binding protein